MNLDYGKDNKERIPFEHYLKEYQKLDPTEVSERTGIPYDKEKQLFTLRMMQKTYLISFPEFSVINKDAEDDSYSILEEETAAKMIAIRFLMRGTGAKCSGNYLTYREVPWGEVYFRQFEGRCLKRLAFSYGSKQDVFKAQMAQIGAGKLNLGDISYEFEFINGYHVRFILWAGDDEFPPSSQILFSDNFPTSFEAEDLAVVGDLAIGTLKKL